MNIQAIFRAGFVRRWHTNPDLAHTCDRIDGHSGRVARLILALHPDPTVDILRAALIHDDGESVTGDMPGHIKAATSDDFARSFDRMEFGAMGVLWGDWNAEICAHPVDDADGDWLKFADRLDAFMWAQHHAPHAMTGDGWPEARTWLGHMASKLRVRDKVRSILGETITAGRPYEPTNQPINQDMGPGI